MKRITFIILSLFILNATYARDKALSLSFSNMTEAYKDKIKSQSPDKVVVFISSRINVDYLDLVEVDFDSPDLTDNLIEFNRPLNSPKAKTITQCKSESGSVSIEASKITISTDRFPIRILCTGDNGNYREAYSTFKSN